MHSMVSLLAQTAPEGRVFGLDLQTFFSGSLQLLNGIILAVALSWLLYKPVKEFLRKRADRIQDEIDQAEATMTKGNELIAEYDKKIQAIDQERIEILEAARLTAEDEAKVILAEAQKEAQEIKKRSLENVSKEQVRFQEESRLYIIELASIMAEKYLTQNIDDESQNKLFEETLAKLEETQWLN
ncbi:MAG TPA: ATP synthase F0 subunit B [Bacilli bacterium]|nr:ATP synthase F0 subunit B [Bacilli bacterium]